MYGRGRARVRSNPRLIEKFASAVRVESHSCAIDGRLATKNISARSWGELLSNGVWLFEIGGETAKLWFAEAKGTREYC